MASGSMESRRRSSLMVSKAVQTDPPPPVVPTARVTLAERASSSARRTRVETNRTFTADATPSPPFQRAREATQYMIRRSIDERFFKAPMALPQKANTLWDTCKLAFQSLGIVYGDLGTSPLYVFPSISCAETPDEEDYLGILSLIFWTLTLIGVLKYTFIVMYADDHGEGGTFAMYSLLCQHTDVGTQSRKMSQFSAQADHHLLHYAWEEKKLSRVKTWMENHRSVQEGLLFVVMLATCMFIGDGVLTPAISVLSAIGGIKTEFPNISQTVIVWVSAIILIVLFCVQKYGTDKVAFLFSPIMALWLLTTPLVGIYNVHRYDTSVFKALSPHFIYRLFKKNGKQGWQFLGGVVLSITGSEAMFADLGHFDRLSIQMAFSLAVYPAVILTYAGQTAYLIHNPEDYVEGFFKMIPRPVFWPMLAISTLAAIVASQGLITATFSIVKQSMALDFFPPVKVVHTSEDNVGQIYSPEVNWGLMVMCCAVVFGFQSGHGIGNAFGFAVVCVMIITTCLMAIIMLVIWETHWVWVLAFFTVFTVVEGCYLSAVLAKVPQGGWLSLSLSVFFTLVMISWNYGRQKKFDYEMKNKLSKKKLGQVLANIGDMRVPVKKVLPAERFLVGRIGYKGVYRCVARYGYLDLLTSETTYFLDQVTQCLTEHIGTDLDMSDNPEERMEEEEKMEEISMIREAKAAGAVYVLGRSEFKVDTNTSCIDTVFAGMIYPFLNSICRSPVSSMHIPPSCFLEVGMKYDLL